MTARKWYRCLWCAERIRDGRDESGYTGDGADWMTDDGDFGCGDSPDSGEDGTGGHTSNELTTDDGHVVRVTLDPSGHHIRTRRETMHDGRTGAPVTGNLLVSSTWDQVVTHIGDHS
jgi:hypothetical protein